VGIADDMDNSSTILAAGGADSVRRRDAARAVGGDALHRPRLPILALDALSRTLRLMKRRLVKTARPLPGGISIFERRYIIISNSISMVVVAPAVSPTDGYLSVVAGSNGFIFLQWRKIRHVGSYGHWRVLQAALY